GLGGLRDRLPARLRAAGGLFRAGSFSGQVRRRGTDDNGHASDFGINPTAGVAVNPRGIILGRRARSPTEGGRRFMSTASGIGFFNFVTAIGSTGGGAAPGSPSISPVLRGAAAAGGTGSFYWRRDAHAAGAVATAAIASSTRAQELRGEVEMLGILRQGENSFVIVVGEEDIDGEGDSEGELDAGSVDGDGIGPPPTVPSGAALDYAGGSEGGRVGAARKLHTHPQRRQSSGAGLSITAALSHMNSGRMTGSSGGGGLPGGKGDGGLGGGRGSLGLRSPPRQPQSGPGL
ncbi:hypothetical protein VaNZ11_014208, partial [Volvox africanus]